MGACLPPLRCSMTLHSHVGEAPPFGSWCLSVLQILLKPLADSLFSSIYFCCIRFKVVNMKTWALGHPRNAAGLGCASGVQSNTKGIRTIEEGRP